MGLEAAVGKIRWWLSVLLLSLGASVLAVSDLVAQAGDYWDVSPSTANLRAGTGAPSPRYNHVACWTGTRLFIWGGQGGINSATVHNAGGMFNPATDTWETRPNLQNGVGAPAPRVLPTAVLADGKIVVFGGRVAGPSSPVSLNTGGVYDPALDVWEVKPNLTNGVGAFVPAPRGFNFGGPTGGGIWTGNRVVVFGGGVPGLFLSNGGMYNLVTDQWENRPNLMASQTPAFNGQVTWTGTHMISRAGSVPVTAASPNGMSQFGGMYDPQADVWLPRPALQGGLLAPAKVAQFVTWTGEWYFEFGGIWDIPLIVAPTVMLGTTPALNGLLYNPNSDQFLSRPALAQVSGGPSYRYPGTMLWTGSGVLMWGGASIGRVDPLTTEFLNDIIPDGWFYDPVRDVWKTLPGLANFQTAPAIGIGRNLVWTGDRVIAWGGVEGRVSNAFVRVNTGGVYFPPSSAPMIRSGQADVALTANQLFRHRVTVYGSPRPTLAVVGLPNWMSRVDLDTGCFLEGSPSATEAATTGSIFITASNGVGTPVTQVLIIGPSSAPSIDPIAPVSVPFGQRFDFRVPAKGPPLPTLTYTGLPSWLSPNEGRIEGVPTQASAGVPASITVTASNGVGTPAISTFTLIVEYPAGVQPGSILMPTSHSIVAGESFGLTIPVLGNPVPIAAVGPNSPNWVRVIGNDLLGAPPLAASGTSATVTIFAQNGWNPVPTHNIVLLIGHNPHDVNRDAAINIVDVQRAVGIIIGLYPSTYPGEGDANLDTITDVVDAQAIVNRILFP